MVLDLRSFDVIEGVCFNELFILVTDPFPNPNIFGLFPDSFEDLKIFGYQTKFQVPFPIPKKFRVPDPTRYFGFLNTSTFHQSSILVAFLPALQRARSQGVVFVASFRNDGATTKSRDAAHVAGN